MLKLFSNINIKTHNENINMDNIYSSTRFQTSISTRFLDKKFI